MSWLPFALTQEGRECTESSSFMVDEKDSDSIYKLVFSPHASCLVFDDMGEADWTKFDHDKKGTLALIRTSAYTGTNLDVSFFVRDQGGEFRQWGERKRFAVPACPLKEEARCVVVGPDVESDAKGVFGLSYDELLDSQWVSNDAITVKVAIKEMVMKAHPEEALIRLADTDFVSTEESVDVPPPTLAAELLAMLTDECHGDVTIEAVFRAALEAGMSESATKTITVTDTPPAALKALLHFLYSDDFAQVEAALREDGGAGASAAGTAGASAAGTAGASAASAAGTAGASAAAPANEQRMAQLQAVLAAAHKYQVARLLRWCEQQLCKQISGETVCSLLGLAHLYEAAALEQRCLKFVKANMAHVVTLPEYAALPPVLLVKVQMHCAGVEPAESKKRKRAAD